MILKTPSEIIEHTPRVKSIREQQGQTSGSSSRAKASMLAKALFVERKVRYSALFGGMPVLLASF